MSGLHTRRGLWFGSQALVVRLQAASRGFLLRRQLQARRRYLLDHTPAVVVIQVRRRKLVELQRPWGTDGLASVCSGPLEEVCPAEGVHTQAALSLHQLESCCQGNTALQTLGPTAGEIPDATAVVLFLSTDPGVCEDVVSQEELPSSAGLLQRKRPFVLRNTLKSNEAEADGCGVCPQVGAVVKIQAFFRASKAQEEYRKLGEWTDRWQQEPPPPRRTSSVLVLS